MFRKVVGTKRQAKHYEKRSTKQCFTSLGWYILTKYLVNLIDIALVQLVNIYKGCYRSHDLL